MKKLVFLVFIFFATELFAMPDGYWASNSDFDLKKDEIGLWDIGGRFLTFRWTLFHNKGLVYLSKFDKFPYQGILYNDYKLSSFKIDIKNTNVSNIEGSYILIDFKQFNSEDKSAKFSIYLFDKTGSVFLKRLKD